MEPIVAAAKTMLESSTGMIQTARSLAVNPKDPPKWSVLAGHSRTVSDSIKKLITNMRYSQSLYLLLSSQVLTRLKPLGKVCRVCETISRWLQEKWHQNEQ